MKFILLIMLQIITKICALNNVAFGVDYFNYKRVRSVINFSCGNTENDIQLIKSFSKVEIYASVYNIESYLPLTKVWEATYWPMGIWLDIRCIPEENTTQIVAEASSQQMFGKLYTWLFVGADFNETLMYLNEDAMSLLTDIVIGVENSSGFNIFDVYNPSKLRDGKLNVTMFGSWRTDNGLRVQLTQDIFSRRCNLHGLFVRVSAVAKYCEPDVEAEYCLTNYDSLGKDSLTKFGYSILSTLAEIYNFRINVIRVNDWWDIYPNGTSFGMMPSLGRLESDFGATPASPRWATRGYSRYILPVWPARFFFIFRDPTRSLKLMELFSPLANDVWYGMMALFGVTTFLLMWMFWFEEGGSWYGQWGWSFLITIGALCQQGLLAVPNRMSGRVVLLSIMIFVFLTFNYYSAKVVTVRINQPPVRINDSLWSLGNIKGMGFATFPYRLIGDILKVSPDWEVKSFYHQVWSQIPLNETILPIEIGLEKVRNGSFAYHANPSAIYPYITNHFEEEVICELNEVHTLKPHQAALFERLHNPFAELARVGILKVWSSGIRKRNIYRWAPTPYKCSPETRSTQPLSLFDTVSPLILIGSGIILSAFLFTFEIIYFKLRELQTKWRKFGKPLKKK